MSGVPTEATISPSETNSEVTFHFAGRRRVATCYSGESILQAARRANIPLNSACERGYCGTCMVTVLAGAVRLRANDVLSESDVASGLTLACQAVPTTPELVIEVF